jgi:hypothetical protein
MSTALLDLIDSDLRLFHDRQVLHSPGYALLRDGHLVFGEEARAMARRQPRNVNTRYWWQLGTKPLQPSLGAARHTADLAHAHMQAVHREAGKPAEFILSVPDSLQRDQLSLLLGIIQACPFDAVGLVNRSVLLGSVIGGGERILHVELQLHQALATELSCDGDEILFRSSQPLTGVGLLALQEQAADVIARAFINNTRFDPRRKADTEQALYDRLAVAVDEFEQRSETTLEISGYRSQLRRDDLAAVGARLADAIRPLVDSGTTLLLDASLARLPGVGDAFPEALRVDDALMQAAIEQHAGRLRQDAEALALVNRLPLKPAESAPRVPEPQQTVTPDTATHILLGELARPLTKPETALEDGTRLKSVEGGWEVAGSGRSDPLRAGDRFTLDSGAEAMLIEVRD